MLLSKKRGSWEFQSEPSADLTQKNPHGQREDCTKNLGLSGQDEDVMTDSWRQHRKHVFVLSEAGKPIYSRFGSEEALSSTMGVMMGLVSFIQAGVNMIKCIFSDQRTIVFLPKETCSKPVDISLPG